MEIVPGRMGLLLTLLLCMVNIFNSADTKYPKTATAINLWILSCILFIILPILEYAVLLGYKKYKKPAKVHSSGRAIASEDDQIETFYYGVGDIIPSALQMSNFYFLNASLDIYL